MNKLLLLALLGFALVAISGKNSSSAFMLPRKIVIQVLKKRMVKILGKFRLFKLGKFGKLVETTKRAKVGSQGNRKGIKR